LKAQIRGGLFVTALSCLVLAACSSAPERRAAAAVKSPKDRRTAPEFALKDVAGTTVRLSDYRGKVVLLNFWATWCSPCTIEIPWFIEFEQKNKDRGFAVVGIAMDEEGWDVVRPFLAEMRVNYRTLKGDDMIAQLYGGVDSLPTTFLIDRQGKIAAAHMGLISKNIYQNEIQELLADPPDRAGLLPVPGPGWAVVGTK
jgi:peroxiredoxin